jgi:hypothetical protein
VAVHELLDADIRGITEFTKSLSPMKYPNMFSKSSEESRVILGFDK